MLVCLFAGSQSERVFSQLWGLLVIFGVSGDSGPPVFLPPILPVCLCLSTQRLIALAKGKMLMVKMKMGGQENESTPRKQR